MRAVPFLPVLLLASAVAASCGPAAPGADGVPHPGARQHGGAGDRTGGHRAEVRLYAAASLTDVLGALAKEFEPLRDGHVVASYGASSTLAQQIREGAAPGVFVSASVEWVEELEGWGLVEPGSRVD